MRLSEKEEQALEKFKMWLKEVLSADLLEVRLFGSKARGDARKDSDIDVLVVISSDDWRVCDAVYSIVTDILLRPKFAYLQKL